MEKEDIYKESNNIMSQIRPHFIFNTLNAIGAVCLLEPEKADVAITQFSDYLRAKFLLLEGKKVIPFETELLHIENYINLERLRFGDKIQLILKTHYTDFSIPVLSIQPIIENAVKYGVSKRSEGGHIIIYTQKLENIVKIVVEDDGVGYPSTTFKQVGASYGMEEIFYRLQTFCKAKSTVTNVPGEGTRVVIEIPLL